MAEFKHGIYGEMGESVISSSKSASIYYAFLGTLPVNLIRLEKNKDGSYPKYKNEGYVNSPMKLVDIETSTPISRLVIDSSVMPSTPSKLITNIKIPRNTPKNVPIRPRYVGNESFAVD